MVTCGKVLCYSLHGHACRIRNYDYSQYLEPRWDCLLNVCFSTTSGLSSQDYLRTSEYTNGYQTG